MSSKPLPLYLENDNPFRIGPIKALDDDPDSPTFGKVIALSDLNLVARVTAAADDDAPIDAGLEVPCPNLGKGFYLVRFEGSILTAAEFGDIVGETRYLVASNGDKDVRVFYELVVTHPRRAELAS